MTKNDEALSDYQRSRAELDGNWQRSAKNEADELEYAERHLRSFARYTKRRTADRRARRGQ